jgi:hypothetical protein
MRSRHFAVLAAAAAAFLAALPAGCERAEHFPVWTKSQEQRLMLFADVEKLAVIPFRDASGAAWPKDFDANKFSKLFADEIIRRARFKVIYPSEIAAFVVQANQETLARARLEKRAVTEDEIIVLGRTEADAVAAGRAAGVDAVLVVTIHDFDPYVPKRLALTVRVYLCGTPNRAAMDIIAMSDAGVPSEVPSTVRDRFIWERQKHYDSLRKNTRTGMDWEGRKHTGDTGFGDEIFRYSTERFMGFVSADLTDSLEGDSRWYEGRLARAGGEPARFARGGGAGALYEPGSAGYTQEHGEHGTGR